MGLPKRQAANNRKFVQPLVFEECVKNNNSANFKRRSRTESRPVLRIEEKPNKLDFLSVQKFGKPRSFVKHIGHFELHQLVFCYETQL